MESHLNNKYYIPEISEFHVGFECELFHQHSESEDHFDKEVYDELTSVWWNRTMDELIRNKEVRVKCLDSADIEECGFVLDETSVKYGSCLEFKKTTYIITINKLRDTPVTIARMVNSEYENNGNNYVLFKGNIRNKSELKRLMKQLGI